MRASPPTLALANGLIYILRKTQIRPVTAADWIASSRRKETWHVVLNVGASTRQCIRSLQILNLTIAMGRDTDNKDKVPLIEHLSTNGRGSTGHPAGVNRALYKYIPLTIIVLQTTVMVLLLRYSKTQKLNEGQGRYLSSTAIVVSEVFKLTVCFAVLSYRGSVNEQGVIGRSSGGLSGLLRTLRCEVYGKPMETCKLLVPAGLYTMQNNLLFLALSRLDAATYQVTYQLKILTTALFSVLLLKRRLSLQQWISLIMLMFGVALVQLPADYKIGEGSSNEVDSSGMTLSRLVGLAAVLLASLSSGFAGAFYERLLKRSTQELWIRNTQLALFGILLGAGAVIIMDLERVLEGGFLQAFGGLAVSYATKYADSILKGFATSISIILSTITAWCILNDFEPSMNFFIGTTIVIAATVLFAMPVKK
ncbi:UDP-N-acetylglucosamine transporter-like isoform X2 [Varroa destructor]|uniref:UDP-N-acetylglucosamine transporter n=1 Tax=Varroa destructor TaxID=109461 RepID=A0A7M7MD95_VARDE|nr:UDP-N-acetylglucosamine transporter-like isoform X2 [Varroa destructor]